MLLPPPPPSRPCRASLPAAEPPCARPLGSAQPSPLRGARSAANLPPPAPSSLSLSVPPLLLPLSAPWLPEPWDQRAWRRGAVHTLWRALVTAGCTRWIPSSVPLKQAALCCPPQQAAAGRAQLRPCNCACMPMLYLVPAPMAPMAVQLVSALAAKLRGQARLLRMPLPQRLVNAPLQAVVQRRRRLHGLRAAWAHGCWVAPDKCAARSMSRCRRRCRRAAAATNVATSTHFAVRQELGAQPQPVGDDPVPTVHSGERPVVRIQGMDQAPVPCACAAARRSTPAAAASAHHATHRFGRGLSNRASVASPVSSNAASAEIPSHPATCRPRADDLGTVLPRQGTYPLSHRFDTFDSSHKIHLPLIGPGWRPQSPALKVYFPPLAFRRS